MSPFPTRVDVSSDARSRRVLLDSVPPDVELEDTPCPLMCWPPADTLVVEGHDRICRLPGRFRVVRCSHCGLLRTNPRPTPQTIGYYYPDDYGPYVATQVAAALPDPEPSSRLRTRLRNWLTPDNEPLPVGPPGRLFEIGCASGAFLHAMASKGWTVQGLELSRRAGEAARSLGHAVHIGPLETAPPPAEQVDVVAGWMVVEHLHDPVAGLRKLHDWVRPGGWLAISVPNAASLERSVFGARWYSLHLPAHLFHFTPKTLQRVLDAAGWTLDRVMHQRSLTNLFGSAAYVLQDAGAPGGDALLRFAEHPGRAAYALTPPALLLAQLGQTGRMTVWARRRG